MGAVGGILAATCFAAPLAIKVRDAFERKDRATAGQPGNLTPLNKEMVTRLGVPGVKAAMDFTGLVGGPVRPPLQDLPQDERSRTAEMLRSAGLVSREAGPAIR